MVTPNYPVSFEPKILVSFERQCNPKLMQLAEQNLEHLIDFVWIQKVNKAQYFFIGHNIDFKML